MTGIKNVSGPVETTIYIVCTHNIKCGFKWGWEEANTEIILQKAYKP